MGSQEPSSYRRSLQTPLRYSIRLQGWASGAPGERLHPSQLQLDEGLHWHGKRPSVPNCKYHTGVPGQARNKAKGSSTRGQRAQAWLRLVLRPHADVCSCRVSTWTCSASGWELLPEFCQGCGLEMLGSSHCTDPAHLPSRAFFPRAQTQLAQAQFQGPDCGGRRYPTRPHGPPQKEGCHANRPASGRGLHGGAAALREDGEGVPHAVSTRMVL